MANNTIALASSRKASRAAIVETPSSKTRSNSLAALALIPSLSATAFDRDRAAWLIPRSNFWI
jgi:hypothetical protein